MVQSFFHGGLHRLHGSHLGLETFGAAQRLEANVARFQPTDTDPFALQLGSHTVGQRHERSQETSLRIDLRENVEHGGELLGLGLGLLGISLGLVIQRDVCQQG